MNKIRKAIISTSIIIIFLLSVIGTALYYQSLLDDRDRQISALESQIANQSKEMKDYQYRISDLERQLADLTSVSITTALGIRDIGNISGSVALPSQYYRLYIAGSVTNDGNGTAYKAGLHVIAYDNGGVLQINMTVPLIAGSTLANFTAVTKIDGSIGNPQIDFTNLAGGETTRVELDIYHKGLLSNWTVTPTYDKYP